MRDRIVRLSSWGLALAFTIPACGGASDGPAQSATAAAPPTGASASVSKTTPPASQGSAPDPSPPPAKEGDAEVDPPVAAPTTKRPPPSQAQRDQLAKKNAAYKQLMSEGRKLSKSGDYEAARDKFFDARDQKPNDASAEGEICWADFQAGKLRTAELFCELAVQHARSDKQLGALLYNHGRIEEARGEYARALARYEQSLAKRDNETVRAKVRELRAKTPKPKGGDPSLDRLCERLLDELHACKASRPACNCEGVMQVANPDAKATITNVAVLAINDVYPDGVISRDYLLTIETKAGGWQYVFAVGSKLENDIHGEMSYAPGSVRFEVAGDTPVVIYDGVQDMLSDSMEDHSFDTSKTVELSICGVVGDGVSCVQFETNSKTDSYGWGDEPEKENHYSTSASIVIDGNGITLPPDQQTNCHDAGRSAPYTFAEFADLECTFRERLK